MKNQGTELMDKALAEKSTDTKSNISDLHSPVFHPLAVISASGKPMLSKAEKPVKPCRTSSGAVILTLSSSRLIIAIDTLKAEKNEAAKLYASAVCSNITAVASAMNQTIASGTNNAIQILKSYCNLLSRRIKSLLDLVSATLKSVFDFISTPFRMLIRYLEKHSDEYRLCVKFYFFWDAVVFILTFIASTEDIHLYEKHEYRNFLIIFLTPPILILIRMRNPIPLIAATLSFRRFCTLIAAIYGVGIEIDKFYSLFDKLAEQENKITLAEERLELCKAGIPDEYEIGDDGLPRDKNSISDWGKTFTLYTAPYGSKLHAKCGCSSATVPVNICKISFGLNRLCSKCAYNYSIPDIEWFKNRTTVDEATSNLQKCVQTYHDLQDELEQKRKKCNSLSAKFLILLKPHKRKLLKEANSKYSFLFCQQVSLFSFIE